MVVQIFLFVCDKRFCTFNRMVSVMSQNQCCLYYLSSNYTSLCAVCQWGLNNFGRNLFVCCFEVWKTSKLPAGQTFRKESYKVFNFVNAKPQLRRAESRFAEPRCSLQRERVVTFCVVQKVTKKHAGLRPATSIQISARYMIFSKMTGVHQVTSRAGDCRLPGYRR